MKTIKELEMKVLELENEILKLKLEKVSQFNPIWYWQEPWSTKPIYPWYTTTISSQNTQ